MICASSKRPHGTPDWRRGANQPSIPMSEIDMQALEANFKKWRLERAPDEADSDAFEIYSIEQILKDSDLSDDEIASGNFGGGMDGGVDGMYLFMNRSLILAELDPPDPALSVELVLIQAKNEKSFTEAAIQKFTSFCTDLLDYTKTVDSFTIYNADVKDAMTLFREKYGEVLGSQHTLNVSFHYTTRSIYQPDPKVVARTEALKAFVRTKLSSAIVTFTFWGCADLLRSARAILSEQIPVEITKHFATSDHSVVCLVNLANFAKLITDDHGSLRTQILEPNVRDYQGKTNPVNQDIRATLDNPNTKEDFWWLNNGITILSKDCVLSGDKITITKPEIVNGLQTSHEVFEVFRNNPDRKDKRSILLRVIVAPEERSRNEIIKATNSQTLVNRVSLRATDRLHFDIEDRLRLYGLFYDRRKGQYKREKKPIAKIISIRALGQAIMAAYLQRPADARARPGTILAQEENYGKLFNDTYDREFYATCVLLDRQVKSFMSSQQALSRDAKVDLRFYVTMLVMARLVKNANPTPEEIAGAVEQCKKPIDPAILEQALSDARQAYEKLGATAKVSKGPELTLALRKKLIEDVGIRVLGVGSS